MSRKHEDVLVERKKPSSCRFRGVSLELEWNGMEEAVYHCIVGHDGGRDGCDGGFGSMAVLAMMSRSSGC
jgi:hypothetical protein